MQNFGYMVPGPMAPPGPVGRRGVGEYPYGINAPPAGTLLDHPGTDGAPQETTWIAELATAVRAYGWNPPPIHSPMNAGGQKNVLANAVRTLIFSDTVPAGCIGVWYSWSQSLAAADYPDITWRLAINNQPIKGFEALTGQFTTLQNPEWILQPIPPNSLIAVLASNTSKTDIASVGARARGWYWPIGTYRTR